MEQSGMRKPSGLRRHPAGDASPVTAAPVVILFSLALLTAVGCGTLAYKTGGTEHEYQGARGRCEAAGRGASPDFERCMAEQGWVVKQLTSPSAKSDTQRNAPVAASSSETLAAPTVGPTASASPVSEAPTPERTIAVKSWFKLGGTADQLAAAKKRCAATLGAAAGPQPESDTVTGAMLDCLRNEGWHGL